MSYPPPSWPYLPPPLLQHSTELEHRLTKLEGQEDWQEDQDKRLDAMDRRLNLHEKAILGILGLLQILMQDKYPAIAAALKSLL